MAVLNDTGSAEMLEVQFETKGTPPFTTQQRVIVTVGRPSDEEYPRLAERLSRRINEHSKTHVRVQVRYVEIDKA